jgi:hypothetical protein
MGLTLRRAAAAKGLLTAAAVVVLGATLALTALIGYGRASSAAGVRGAVAAADAEDRSILVRGSAGADLSARDRAVRAAYAGIPATVRAAAYASGWAFAGATGAAVPDPDGVVYASVVALEDLPGHAELVAEVLGVSAGDRLPLLDRRTDRVTRLTVSGIWRPRDPADPYWRLVPGAAAGRVPQTATYGPLVVDRSVFDARFATAASAGWLVEPRMDAPTVAQVTALAAAADRIAAGLPERTGLGPSAIVTTGLGELRDRLRRAELVGRSALATPVLLIVVLTGTTLLLVALLLTESRRAETAQLRARGAARHQLAGFALREALLVVLPGALIAPPLAVLAVEALPVDTLRLTVRPDPALWVAAALAATGAVVALLGPALRRGTTYVADVAGRSRRSVVQRAGLDLALVVLAGLGWLQLRRYGSPLTGGALGVDPLLAAAPTLGVLAGAVLAMRLLPPVAGFAARRLDRRAAPAAQFGTWQAARRAHAGPLVLIALAVSAGTVSWCLAGTADRSLADQVDHRVGADLRLVETGGSAPPGRAAELAGRPGLRTVLAAWRDTVQLGPATTPADLIALDTARAGGVVRVRDDVAGGDDRALFRRLARARGELPVAALGPAVITTTGGPVRTTAVLADGTRVELGASDDGRPVRFAGGEVAGFVIDAGDRAVLWRISGLGTGWQAVDRTGFQSQVAAGSEVRVAGRAAVTRPAPATLVPVAVTPQALAGLGPLRDRPLRVTVRGVPVDVRVAATLAAVPGAAGSAAVLADLPALQAQIFNRYGIVHDVQEWWIAGDAAAAAGLRDVQVLDRRQLAAEADRDPFGAGSRLGLFAAAVGALVLAGAGIAVDAQATARRRAVELAVLHTLGAGPGLLARSLVVEQMFLAGLGALAGLLVGLAVAATTAPLLILTPSAGRPVPAPLLQIDWWLTGGTALLVVGAALGVSAVAAAVAGRRLPATRLRIGMDR